MFPATQRGTHISHTEWRCIGGSGGGRGGAGVTPQNSGLPTGQLSLNKILNLMDISKTIELMCHRDVIDAMKRAWRNTQNGTSGNEAGSYSLSNLQSQIFVLPPAPTTRPTAEQTGRDTPAS